jgi:hypothetical protein
MIQNRDPGDEDDNKYENSFCLAYQDDIYLCCDECGQRIDLRTTKSFICNKEPGNLPVKLDLQIFLGSELPSSTSIVSKYDYENPEGEHQVVLDAIAIAGGQKDSDD